MAPKDVHALIPRSLGHVRVRGKREPKSAAQQTSSWGDYHEDLM